MAERLKGGCWSTRIGLLTEETSSRLQAQAMKNEVNLCRGGLQPSGIARSCVCTEKAYQELSWRSAMA